MARISLHRCDPHNAYIKITPRPKFGLTTTPKETTEVTNIDYFGERLLKEGIEEVFLAPY